ncbi:hypothetical protein Q8A67_022034 [Cirrhinus molitorella]|uniref:Uncharacterized protein n=1 Tax=Cirrhinus molitorella TaxID=172907 RepID=A0AA88P9K8_9TELE|nr:hypothetical protein Q8A67_022034 [Cirrhinus molitorella]
MLRDRGTTGPFGWLVSATQRVIESLSGGFLRVQSHWVQSGSSTEAHGKIPPEKFAICGDPEIARLCLSSPLPASAVFTAFAEGEKRKRSGRDNRSRTMRLRFEMMSGPGRFSRSQ